MRRRLLFCIAVNLVLAAVPSLAKTKSPHYTVCDLGTLGGEWSHAWDVNDHGQVVGQAACVPGANGDSIGHAFLWEKGRMYDLGTPQAFQSSYAYGINDKGQVCGSGYDLDDSDQHPFLWQKGRMTALPIPAGLGCDAVDINSSGQIAMCVDMHPVFDAYLWYKGTATCICRHATARAINDSGQLVGESQERAFIWRKGAGSVTYLGTLGGSWSIPSAINNSGQVVGRSETAPAYSGPTHAFFWWRGKMIDLGPGEAYDINERGQIVGSSDSEWPVLWDNGAQYQINDLIPAGLGWVVTEARAINNCGQIVGCGWINGSEHAVLLSPK